MKRFLKTFTLLTASLVLLVTGVDVALDHFSHSAAQNTVTVYTEQGGVILAYSGDLNGCKIFVKPTAAPNFLHRT